MPTFQKDSTEAPPHPEEIRSDFELRIGKHITLEGSARITPAGVISAGLATAAILVAVGFTLSAARGHKSSRIGQRSIPSR